MLLSRNFRLAEFQSPDGTPMSTEHVEQLAKLCREYLQPLRDRFGATTVHSGFRSVAWNQRVGGAPLSFHLEQRRRHGAAADVSCAAGSPRDWADFLEAIRCPGVGRYRGHVHADNRHDVARWRG